MNFILLFGPPAAGKMTVGQELAKLAGYKLLYNHMTIDLVREILEFDSPEFWRLVAEMRRAIVREAAASPLPGLIFTFVWDFGTNEDQGYVDELCGYVTEHGGECYFAELETGFEERLRRNRTEHRLRHKKIEPDFVEAFMRDCEGKGRTLNTDDDHPFPYPDRHIKIENTHITAAEAARMIRDHFGL